MIRLRELSHKSVISSLFLYISLALDAGELMGIESDFPEKKTGQFAFSGIRDEAEIPLKQKKRKELAS